MWIVRKSSWWLNQPNWKIWVKTFFFPNRGWKLQKTLWNHHHLVMILCSFPLMLFPSIMDIPYGGPPVGPVRFPSPRKPPCSGYQGLIDNCLSLGLPWMLLPRGYHGGFFSTNPRLYTFFFLKVPQTGRWFWVQINNRVTFFYYFFMLKTLKNQNRIAINYLYLPHFIETDKNPWAIISQRFPISLLDLESLMLVT